MSSFQSLGFWQSYLNVSAKDKYDCQNPNDKNDGNKIVAQTDKQFLHNRKLSIYLMPFSRKSTLKSSKFKH